MKENFSVCEGESTIEMPMVKYKWLRAITIGNRSDTEWAYFEEAYPAFEDMLISYYEDTYRLHNWVYKRQVHSYVSYFSHNDSYPYCSPTQ